MGPLKEDLKAETFYKAASDMNDMDARRVSWRNEDPNWKRLGWDLDDQAILPSSIRGQMLPVAGVGNTASVVSIDQAVDTDTIDSPPVSEPCLI